MNFVLDASVALSWLLEDAGAGQAYADTVFEVVEASRRPSPCARNEATRASRPTSDLRNEVEQERP